MGATFAATMGDEAGYEAAKTGLKAISDYASGTGKNVDELSQKFTLITRSTSSYQSIADQFSGILPATSAGFLEQAQAAGILSDSYTQLTEVPIEEYQAAVSQMLQRGVTDLGLANNTMNEAFSTLSGSLSMAKGAWSNLVTGLADDSADLDMLIGNFVESVGAVATQLIPKIGTALNGASKLVRDLIPVIVQEIPELIEENLPILAEAAISIIQSLVDGISENQEMLMETAFETITYLANSLITMLPKIVKLGLDLIVSLANGISEYLPALIPSVVGAVVEIVKTITEPAQLEKIMNAALTLILALVDGLMSEDSLSALIDAVFILLENMTTYMTNPENLKKFWGVATKIVASLMNGLMSANDSVYSGTYSLIKKIIHSIEKTDWMQVGKDIVVGIWNALKPTLEKFSGWFVDKWSGLVSGVKDLLGIHSPSRVFAGIGKNMALGVGEGWADEFGDIQDDIDKSLSFDDPLMGINSSVRKVGHGMAYGGTSIGNININIDGARYTDEQSLAAAIALEIQNMTDRRAAVYA